MARQVESIFSARVARFLDGLPRTWHMRLHSTLVSGLPDRIAVINGRFVALEIKASKSAPRSKLQGYILLKMSMAGAFAEFVYPEVWDEVQDVLRRMSESRD